jgi:hypothetical protein
MKKTSLELPTPSAGSHLSPGRTFWRRQRAAGCRANSGRGRASLHRHGLNRVAAPWRRHGQNRRDARQLCRTCPDLWAHLKPALEGLVDEGLLDNPGGEAGVRVFADYDDLLITSSGEQMRLSKPIPMTRDGQWMPTNSTRTRLHRQAPSHHGWSSSPSGTLPGAPGRCVYMWISAGTDYDGPQYVPSWSKRRTEGAAEGPGAAQAARYTPSWGGTRLSETLQPAKGRANAHLREQDAGVGENGSRNATSPRGEERSKRLTTKRGQVRSGLASSLKPSSAERYMTPKSTPPQHTAPACSRAAHHALRPPQHLHRHMRTLKLLLGIPKYDNTWIGSWRDGLGQGTVAGGTRTIGDWRPSVECLRDPA